MNKAVMELIMAGVNSCTLQVISHFFIALFVDEAMYACMDDEPSRLLSQMLTCGPSTSGGGFCAACIHIRISWQKPCGTNLSHDSLEMRLPGEPSFVRY